MTRVAPRNPASLFVTVLIILVAGCSSPSLPTPSTAASPVASVGNTPSIASIVPSSVPSPAASAAPSETFTRLPPIGWTFESSAFPTVGNRDIQARYTCDGADRSPPLTWTIENLDTGAPVAYAIMLVDTDDHDKVHWVLAGIPGNVASLAAGAGNPAIPNGFLQGHNDFGTLGYVGPCPRPGRLHRYEFDLLAFASVPSLPDHPTAYDLRAAVTANDGTTFGFSAFYGR